VSVSYLLLFDLVKLDLIHALFPAGAKNQIEYSRKDLLQQIVTENTNIFFSKN
jgi:hypothetical protein